jgi:hypothetical protein
MANSNNDVRELEDLLTELEGQGALPVGPYSDEDDAVTQLMDTPLGDQEWMIQITPLDRRMMSTDQLLAELATGTLVKRDMLVWRTGMSDWAPIHRMDELAGSGVIDVAGVPDRSPVADRSPVVDRSPVPERRPAPLPPPPAPIPPRLSPKPLGSSTLASPGALPPPPSLASSRVPAPSTPFGAPRPLTPVPDAPPPSPLPLLNSAFGSSSVTPLVPPVAPLPELGSAFHVPPPAAAPSGVAQQPPPPPTMRTTTQRPVAVDFSEIEPARPAPMRVLIGSGVAAVAMIVGTVFALSAGGVFESGPETSHVAPERVAAASPAPATAKPAEARAAESKPPESKAPADKAAAEPSRASDEPQTQPVSAKEELVAAPELRGAAKESAAKEDEAPKADQADKEPAKSKAAASGDDEQEEASTSAKTRAERRLARRQKRTNVDDERASAPRRTKARATPAATAPQAPAAESEAAPKPTASDPPGSTFNRQAAKTALDDAAAQARNCRPQGGPSGSGKVQVRYEPNGKVGAVSLLTPTFDNTTTGDCVVMVFRRASIPAFTGSPPVVMNKSFEIP